MSYTNWHLKLAVGQVTVMMQERPHVVPGIHAAINPRVLCALLRLHIWYCQTSKTTEGKETTKALGEDEDI